MAAIYWSSVKDKGQGRDSLMKASGRARVRASRIHALDRPGPVPAQGGAGGQTYWCAGRATAECRSRYGVRMTHLWQHPVDTFCRGRADAPPDAGISSVRRDGFLQRAVDGHPRNTQLLRDGGRAEAFCDEQLDGDWVNRLPAALVGTARFGGDDPGPLSLA